MSQNIRNFCIIAHVDHGKSTLADRLLELTGTVPKNKMHPQFLDRLPLERERGITIKMQPVRMVYQAHRGIDAANAPNNAEKLLYEDLTYKIRGAIFEVRKKLGLGHKEQVYHNALEIELEKISLAFESKKNIRVYYNGKPVSTYQPDFIIENRILIELKALPEIGRPQIEQLWSYLKGYDHKLALLANFGSKDLEIRRIVYDTARDNNSALSASSPRPSAQIEDYILNLIDTPGHTDFSYEVSRSLKAVEGAILLVEAAKGVQAQTVSNYEQAKKQGLKIIPVINKIDLPEADVENARAQLAKLIGCRSADILKISAKSGLNVEQVLDRVISDVPAPQGNPEEPLKALIFDSAYDPYKGVIVYVRLFQGQVKAGAAITMLATQAQAAVKEVGFFTPDLKPTAVLAAGSIGYIATGLKDIDLTRVGDTVTRAPTTSAVRALPGYTAIQPRVFASVYPENEADFDDFTDALKRLKLNDAALSYALETSGALGRGYRAGFLGTLHLEIVIERLKREFGQQIIVTSPSVAYEVSWQDQGEIKSEIISSPAFFPAPDRILEIREPWVALEITTPEKYLGAVMTLLNEFRAEYETTDYLTITTAIVRVKLPLAEIMEHFHDRLKSVSAGYASADYREIGYRPGDLVKLEFLVAHELVEAFSKIVPRERAQGEGAKIARLLKKFIPPQLFTVAIQARVNGGKIIAREDIKARRKDVTGYLYGGDYTRKRKLLEKQKRGKKRMTREGRVNIPKETFLKLVTSKE